MPMRFVQRVIAKTADYTIKPPMDASGTCFTNRGATGAVVFTLPAPGPALMGWHYSFRGVADQNITVATATADTLIAKNDVAADSIALSTSGEKIGGVMTVFCDGTSWIASVASVGHTLTVNT